MPPADALLVRTGALGDLLLLRRAVAALNATGRRVCLLAPGPAGAALVGPGGSETSAWLDAAGAGLAALWARDAETPHLLQQAVARDAVAYAVSADADLARNLGRVAGRVIVQSPVPPPGVHASDWIAEPLRSIGCAPARAVPSLEFTDAERAAAREWTDRLPDRFLALHPGSGSPRKNWPAERYAEIARVLAPGQPFLAIRGPADEAAAEPLLRLANAVPAAGLPARVLGAALSRAGLLVGNDSGVTHLAAAAGAPTLALFGPTDPAQWAPVGTSVRVLRAEPLDALCAASVAEAAATFWERGPRSR